jgi:hypothetical protein
MGDLSQIRGKDHLSEGFLDVVHTLFTEMGETRTFFGYFFDSIWSRIYL